MYPTCADETPHGMKDLKLYLPHLSSRMRDTRKIISQVAFRIYLFINRSLSDSLFDMPPLVWTWFLIFSVSIVCLQGASRTLKRGNELLIEFETPTDKRLRHRESHEPGTTLAPLIGGSAPDTDTTDLLTVHNPCQTDALLTSGRCVCGETPCFHGASLLRLPRGREVPGLMNGLYANMLVIAELADLDLYELDFDRAKLQSLRESVSALAGPVNLVQSIIADGISTNPEGPWIRIWYTAAGLIDRRITKSNAYHRLVHEVLSIKAKLANVAEGPILAVGVLFIQALSIVENLVTVSLSDDSPFEGWAQDIIRLGVPESVGREAEDPLRRSADMEMDIYLLKQRIGEVHSKLMRWPYVVDKWEDEKRSSQLRIFLDQLPQPPHESLPSDRFVLSSIQSDYCPILTAVLTYLRWLPGQPDRVTTRMILALIKMCNPSVEARMDFGRKFLISSNPVFDFVLRNPPDDESDLVNIHVDASSRENLVKESIPIIEAVPGIHRFPYNIRVSYTNSPGVGDGMRRDWLEAMIADYFNPESTDPVWEFTSDDRTAIRPVQVSVMSTTADKKRLGKKLRASGRLIGLALLNRLVPGVPLSPASLALLQTPKSAINYDELCFAEDPQFAMFTDRLRTIDWTSSDEVEMTVGDLVVQREGASEPVTKDNVDVYISRRKFEKAVTSIREEMELVQEGVYEVIRHGTLDLMSPEELGILIRGAKESLTAESVLAGITFHVFPEVMLRTWFINILNKMNEEDLARFLKFVSGSAKPPMFQEGKWMQVSLDPMMDRNRLPKAATCFKTLTIPPYPSQREFRRKLLYAIREGITIELK